MAPNAFAPPVDYWHLDVPGDVSLGVNADKAHRGGITGKGVKVVMVDSRLVSRTRTSSQRGYRVAPGHRSARARPTRRSTRTATAPPSRPTSSPSRPTSTFHDGEDQLRQHAPARFNAAVGARPRHHHLQLGLEHPEPAALGAANQALAAAIAAAVANGIVVVFSAGNGHFGFPGQHPDVISAGGVFMDADGDSAGLATTPAASPATIYPGRNVPDVCGLVGMRPRAAYIMLPLPGGLCDRHRPRPAARIPNGDETADNDGWAAISGTSAAAPQLAGVAALIKQACPRLTPAEVRDIMRTHGARRHRRVRATRDTGGTGRRRSGPRDRRTAWSTPTRRCWWPKLALPRADPIQPDHRSTDRRSADRSPSGRSDRRSADPARIRSPVRADHPGGSRSGRSSRSARCPRRPIQRRHPIEPRRGAAASPGRSPASRPPEDVDLTWRQMIDRLRR